MEVEVEWKGGLPLLYFLVVNAGHIQIRIRIVGVYFSSVLRSPNLVSVPPAPAKS